VTLNRLARIVRRRVASVVLSSRLDRELDRELQLHLEALVAEKIAEGLRPETALLEARRALGNLAVLRDACRDQRGVNWWQDLGQDVRYGCRVLAAAPVFTAVALVSLALGIGANAAVLGLMAVIRHDSVPAMDADRLVVLRSVSQDNAAGTRGVSAADYLAWKERSSVLDSLELSIAGPRDLGHEDDTPAERTTGQSVTAGHFGMLGAEPLLGRVFTADEARAGARVVVLSHGLWQRRYGGAFDILSRSIPVDAGQSTVIGVMPEEYSYRNPRVAFWTPMHIGPAIKPGAGRLFAATARLKPGVTLLQAENDLAAISAQLAVERPAVNAGWSVQVIPLREHLYGWTREPLINLQVAISLVLVMACANIAALLLARGTVRRRELALRVVLGAGRTRLVRQLLTESLLLSLGGGALGLLVAWGTLHGLVAMIPPIGAPPIEPVRLDLRILGLTAAFSMGTAILFGLAPALVVSRLSPAVPLDGPGPVTVARRGGAMRTVLVTGQIALALMLLAGFGLLTNSFMRLTHRDLNFDPAGLLMFEVRTASPQKVLGQRAGFTYFEMLNVPSQTMSRVHQRLKAIPGAEAVAGISFPPVDSLILPVMDVRVERRSPGDRGWPSLRAAYFLVTPGFFHTLRTPLVSGRDVTDADTASRPWVAIINEAAARQFWPGEDPIGRRLTLDIVAEEQPREVIGIVRDIPTRHAEVEPQPVIYASYVQQPSRYRGPYGVMFGQMTFVVRHTGEPLGLVPAVRKAVAEIETRPISSVMTAESRRALGTERTRYNLLLLGVLATVGSLLASVGVYGLLAYSVSLRTREIGIRKALGAGPNAVLMFLARHVLVVVLAGLAIGWAGALASTRLLASQLWGITPADPWTFVAVSLLLFALALLACLGPAHRAIAVDPTIALRSE
jgi:putative ABC transport system permease protein